MITHRGPTSGEQVPLEMPSGWFVAALSAELPRERILTCCFMGQELVLYRTRSGVVRASSPYCPHLGAHLGRCGTVEGELLRCGFHRFCFDGSGACTRTGYGTRPPPAARLQAHAVREQHGVILVHHDGAGQRPAWEVPRLDSDGWSPLVFRKYSLRGHPQETTENGVDVGHFSIVHGFENVRVLQAPRTEGPRLHARYGVTRRLGVLSRLGIALPLEFDVHAHGLGYSLVEVDVKSHGIRSRHFVFATPTEPGHIDLRIAVSVKEALGGRLCPGLPVRLLTATLARVLFILYARDIGQDFDIWQHKRYLPRPALAVGDGPIGLYRRWARQFYAA